jgi:hypothetical protein
VLCVGCISELQMEQFVQTGNKDTYPLLVAIIVCIQLALAHVYLLLIQRCAPAHHSLSMRRASCMLPSLVKGTCQTMRLRVAAASGRASRCSKR